MGLSWRAQSISGGPTQGVSGLWEEKVLRQGLSLGLEG